MIVEDKVRVRLYEPNRGYNCFKLNIAEPKVYVVRDYVMLEMWGHKNRLSYFALQV
jgi:hypothetical protein